MAKIVDHRNTSEVGEYGIAFAERDAQGSYDHAFVVWYSSDEAGHRTNRRAAGFYPTGDGALYDLIIEGVPGKVDSDSRELIAKQIIVLINSDIMEKALSIEKQYHDATYRLATNDCVSFVEAVAKCIPGLNIPSRLLNLFPSSYIEALHDSN